ncbi:hypothetical protein BHM03_00052147 [Ensete ventricosum]|nr:hypothetical protein BHM03_00052147 [Ensete ventricosum]
MTLNGLSENAKGMMRPRLGRTMTYMYKSGTPKALGGLSQTLERLPMARLLAGVVSCAKAPVGAVAYGQTASMSDLLRLRAPAYRLPAGRSTLAHKGGAY